MLVVEYNDTKYKLVFDEAFICVQIDFPAYLWRGKLLSYVHCFLASRYKTYDSGTIPAKVTVYSWFPPITNIPTNSYVYLPSFIRILTFPVSWLILIKWYIPVKYLLRTKEFSRAKLGSIYVHNILNIFPSYITKIDIRYMPILCFFYIDWIIS